MISVVGSTEKGRVLWRLWYSSWRRGGMKAARHHRCFTTRPGKWTQTLTQLGFMLTVHHWTLRFQSCVWGTLFHLRTGRWVCMPSFPSHINPLRLSHMLARVRLPAQQYGSSCLSKHYLPLLWNLKPLTLLGGGQISYFLLERDINGCCAKHTSWVICLNCCWQRQA